MFVCRRRIMVICRLQENEHKMQNHKINILYERPRAASSPDDENHENHRRGPRKSSAATTRLTACRVRNVHNIHTYLHKNTQVRIKGPKHVKSGFFRFRAPGGHTILELSWPAQRRKFFVFWTCHGEKKFSAARGTNFSRGAAPPGPPRVFFLV